MIETTKAKIWVEISPTPNDRITSLYLGAFEGAKEWVRRKFVGFTFDGKSHNEEVLDLLAELRELGEELKRLEHGKKERFVDIEKSGQK